MKKQTMKTPAAKKVEARVENENTALEESMFSGKEEPVIGEPDVNMNDEPKIEVPVSAIKKDMDTAETEIRNWHLQVDNPDGLINCLKNQRVCIKYVMKSNSKITDPKHVFYGGMAENATKTFVVPKLSSGQFVNVLTNEEKDYLEYIMGLKKNALSIYNKEHNFWSTANPDGLGFVALKKQDNYLNLNNPMDYIKYKILLANKDFIAPSLQELQDRPKATYQYVIVNEGDEAKAGKSKMNSKMECYKEYGKIEMNHHTLRFVASVIENRPIARNTPLEALQNKMGDYIERDPQMFLRVVKDPLIDNKVLINRCVDESLIGKRGTFYYLKEGASYTPMCEYGQEPTLSNAARWLAAPRRQDIKFTLEDKIQEI